MQFVIKEAEEEVEARVELALEVAVDYIRLVGRSEGDEKTLMVFKNGKFRRIVGSELDGIEVNASGKIMEGEA